MRIGDPPTIQITGSKTTDAGNILKEKLKSSRKNISKDSQALWCDDITHLKFSTTFLTSMIWLDCKMSFMWCFAEQKFQPTAIDLQRSTFWQSLLNSHSISCSSAKFPAQKITHWVWHIMVSKNVCGHPAEWQDCTPFYVKKLGQKVKVKLPSVVRLSEKSHKYSHCRQEKCFSLYLHQDG